MWLTSALGSGSSAPRPDRRQADAGHGLSFALARYGIAPGVELTGKLDATGSGYPLLFKGTLTVSGKNAAPGKVTLKKDVLTGTLGGVEILVDRPRPSLTAVILLGQTTSQLHV